MNKCIIPILIALLLLSSGFVGVSNTSEVDSKQKSTDKEQPYNRFNEHYYPEGYFSGQNPPRGYDDVVSSEERIENEKKTVAGNKYHKPQSTAISGGPMDSPWPMFMHDVRHTGQSPYSTADNPYDEKWQFTAKKWEIGSPVIDDRGVIYFCPVYLYAIYPNGTLKWKYEDWDGTVAHTAPAIDENGTIYIGLAYNLVNSRDFYALYPNGTVKWIYLVGNNVFSSPVIGDDGSIYFGGGKNFYAVYPNGTLKWKYVTGDFIWGSSPAIADDGIVYCGSHDDYVYAWFPNNGTVKWKFNTGTWVHGSPTIGDDGTIYIGSDNSLYALYPNNGTMKWRCSIGAIWGSPTLGDDETIYVGVFEEKFYAVYPNGTIKWTFDAGGRIWFGSSAAISADGTLYFGTTSAMGGHGSDFIALNPDGTEKWRYSPGWYESSPAIGEDGTVYIVSSMGGDLGCLHAFGNFDPNAPDAPIISGRTSGKAGKEYDYKFTTTDPNGDDVYYYIEWGDGSVEDWFGPYGSDEEITFPHTWDDRGDYTIRARAKDKYNLWGPWGYLNVTMPMNQQTTFSSWWFLRWLQNHPRMFPILRQLLGL